MTKPGILSSIVLQAEKAKGKEADEKLMDKARSRLCILGTK